MGDIVIRDRVGGDWPPEAVLFNINGTKVRAYRNAYHRFFISSQDLSSALGYSSKEGCMSLVSDKDKFFFSDLVIDDVETVMTLIQFEKIEPDLLQKVRWKNNPVIQRALKGGYKNKDGSIKTDKEEIKKSASFMREYGVYSKAIFIPESALHSVIMRANKTSEETKRRLSKRYEAMSQESYLKTLPDYQDRLRLKVLVKDISRLDRMGMDNLETTAEVEEKEKEFIEIVSRSDSRLSLSEMLLGSHELLLK